MKTLDHLPKLKIINPRVNKEDFYKINRDKNINYKTFKFTPSLYEKNLVDQVYTTTF